MGGLLALSRGIDAVTSFIGRLVSWMILLAVLVSAGNALIRYFQNTALFQSWGIRASNAYLELQWYLYGAAFLLAAAWTLKENEHIRIDIIYGQLRRSVQHWVDLIGTLLFLMPFTFLVIWLVWPWFLRGFRTGEMSQNVGGLILWPARFLILAGFVLLAVQGISELIKKIAVMRGVVPDPHALSNKEAALREAEEHVALHLAETGDLPPGVQVPHHDDHAKGDKP
ncbi:MAG: TRAP transporter small permease subunit [Paracoccus sp. (in: a-proteobacteria)]|nr:TRAP transporter small permease subunit [Paracoccus sp. (in: a-proteobacteria)]